LDPEFYRENKEGKREKILRIMEKE